MHLSTLRINWAELRFWPLGPHLWISRGKNRKNNFQKISFHYLKLTLLRESPLKTASFFSKFLPTFFSFFGYRFLGGGGKILNHKNPIFVPNCCNCSLFFFAKILGLFTGEKKKHLHVSFRFSFTFPEGKAPGKTVKTLVIKSFTSTCTVTKD